MRATARSCCVTARWCTSRSCGRAAEGTVRVAAALRAPRSPHGHALGRRQVELLTGLHRERLVPGIEIAHGVGAVLGRGVPVGDHLLPQRRLADLALPGLGEAQEEQLLAAEAVRLRCVTTLEGEPPGIG